MKKGIEAFFAIFVLCFSFQANAAKSDSDLHLKYSQDSWNEGSMIVFATEDGSKVKSTFTATNGIVIDLESTKDKHQISLGEIAVQIIRLESGNVLVSTDNRGKKSTHVYSKSDINQASVSGAISSIGGADSGLNSAELDAYLQYVNFLGKNNPSISISPDGSAQGNTITAKCVLYVLGTGLAGAATAELCVVSFGWGCAAAIAGTIMVWDAAMGVCGV